MTAARPDAVPEWATDDTFDATGKAWDGLPNKTAPAPAKQAEGFEPAERPAADYLNWWMHAAGGWARHVRNVQVANWFARPFLDSALAEIGTDLGAQRCGVFDDLDDGGSGQLFLVGDPTTDAYYVKTRELETWDYGSIDASTPPSLFGMCVAKGAVNLLVAVGDGQAIYTCPRTGAISWTQRLGPTSGTLRGVAYGTTSQCLVAVGDAGLVYSSSNGTAWTARSGPSGTEDLKAVAFGAGLWVAVGKNGTNNAVVYTSPDGITWTSRTVSSYSGLTHVVYDARAARWCAIGLNTQVLTSDDGITWTEPTAPWGTTGSNDAQGLATDGEGTIVAVYAPSGDTWPRAYVSVDGGVTWDEDSYVIASPDAFTIFGLIWAGRLGWVVVGEFDPGGSTTQRCYSSLRL